MADSAAEPWRTRPGPQSVAACTGTSVVEVHGGSWACVAPGLSPEVAAMLAPPVTVSVVPFGRQPVVDERRRAELARYRHNMAAAPPYGRHRRSARAK